MTANGKHRALQPHLIHAVTFLVSILLPLEVSFQQDNWTQYWTVRSLIVRIAYLSPEGITGEWHLILVGYAIFLALPSIYFSYKLRSNWKEKKMHLALGWVIIVTFLMSLLVSYTSTVFDLSGYQLYEMMELVYLKAYATFALLLFAFLPAFSQTALLLINVDNSSSEKLTIPRNIGKLKLYSKLLVYGVGGLAIFAPFVVRIYNLEPTTAIFVHGSIWLTSIIYPGMGDIELGIWTFSLLGAEALTFNILLSGIRILFAYDIIHYSITEKHTKRTVIIGLLAVMFPFLYFSIPSLPDVYGWTAPVEISQVLPIPILVIGGLLILRYISPVIEEYRATLLTSKKPRKGRDEHISVPIIYTVISRIKNLKRKRQKSEGS